MTSCLQAIAVCSSSVVADSQPRRGGQTSPLSVKAVKVFVGFGELLYTEMFWNKNRDAGFLHQKSDPDRNKQCSDSVTTGPWRGQITSEQLERCVLKWGTFRPVSSSPRSLDDTVGFIRDDLPPSPFEQRWLCDVRPIGGRRSNVFLPLRCEQLSGGPLTLTVRCFHRAPCGSHTSVMSSKTDESWRPRNESARLVSVCPVCYRWDYSNMSQQIHTHYLWCSNVV